MTAEGNPPAREYMYLYDWERELQEIRFVRKGERIFAFVDDGEVWRVGEFLARNSIDGILLIIARGEYANWKVLDPFEHEESFTWDEIQPHPLAVSNKKESE